MRLWKALGTALLVVLVLALTASVASAREVHIEGTSAPFTVKAESSNMTYTIEGSTIKCKKTSWSGTVGAKAVETLELAPTFSECTAFGFTGATVNASECADAFTFALLLTQQYEFALLYDIACLASKAITVTAGTCQVKIGSQTSKEEAGGFNLKTSPKTVELETDVTGLAYTKVQDGFLCPLNGTGEKADGKLEGNLTLKAFEGSTQKGMYVE
jgi:hypothetical protein